LKKTRGFLYSRRQSNIHAGRTRKVLYGAGVVVASVRYVVDFAPS